NGENARRGLLHAAVPQLEVSSVFLLPVPVEVDEHVDSAVEAKLFVPIEVGVNLEKSSPQNLVEATAKKVRIGNETADAGDSLERRDEDRGVQFVDEMPRQRPQLSLVPRRQLQPRCGGVLPDPVDIVGTGILVQNAIQ